MAPSHVQRALGSRTTANQTKDVPRIVKLRQGLQDIVDLHALDSSGQWAAPAKLAREVLEEDDENT